MAHIYGRAGAAGKARRPHPLGQSFILQDDVPAVAPPQPSCAHPPPRGAGDRPSGGLGRRDRKSTRLNSSHSSISYAVFCLKKKNKPDTNFSLYKKKNKK